MSRTIKPITARQLEMVHMAVTEVRAAYTHLKDAGALTAAAKVKSVMKSVQGAERHALRRFAEVRCDATK